MADYSAKEKKMTKLFPLNMLLFIATTLFALSSISTTLHATDAPPLTIFFSNNVQGETEACG